MRAVAAAFLLVPALAGAAFSAGAQPIRHYAGLVPTRLAFEVRAARDLTLDSIRRDGRRDFAHTKTDVARSLGWLQRAVADAKKAAMAAVSKQLGIAFRDELLAEGFYHVVPQFRKDSEVVLLKLDPVLASLARREINPLGQPPPTVPVGLPPGLDEVDTILDTAIEDTTHATDPTSAFDPIDEAVSLLDQLALLNLPDDYLLVSTDRAIADGISDVDAAGRESTWQDEEATYQLARADFRAAAAALGELGDELDADGFADLASQSDDVENLAIALAAKSFHLATLTDAHDSPTEEERASVVAAARQLAREKAALIAKLPKEFGLDRVEVVGALEKAIFDLEHASRAETEEAERGYLDLARDSKEQLEQLLRSAETLTITTKDGWTHNESIGKSRDCVNVWTDPKQSFISGTVSGPQGTADLPLSPMADGYVQVRVVIGVPGAYTWKLTVYDANKNATGSVTVVSDVQPPPTNQAISPPCAAPTS